MEFNAYSMLVDFMWAGIFLFVAKMLREKNQDSAEPVCSGQSAGWIYRACVRTEWFWNYQFFFTVWFLCRSADYCSICINWAEGL